MIPKKFAALALFFALDASAITRPATTFDMSFDGKQLKGTETRRGTTRTFRLSPIKAQAGLFIISSSDLSRALGDTAVSEQHPFSFADPALSQIRISAPQGFLTVTSYKRNGLVSELARPVFLFAEKRAWSLHQVKVRGTSFSLLSPKLNPQIDGDAWKSMMRRVWPKLVDRFGAATDYAAFVDLQGPISGGPLGDYVLGFFANDTLSADDQKDMTANLGWAPQKSTREYVRAHYISPKLNGLPPGQPQDAWSEYLIGTFAHEMTHLYFGFGVTRERISVADELWFSLGLGMVYDREITRELTGRAAPLEQDLIEHWRSHVAKLPQVDQRLIRPDRSKDSQFDFDRKKVFAHGKATAFLEDLRDGLGKKPFDDLVNRYLKLGPGKAGGYDSFIALLSTEQRLIASALESRYATR